MRFPFSSFVWETIKRGMMKVVHVFTGEKHSDMLMKPCVQEKLRILVKEMKEMKEMADQFEDLKKSFPNMEGNSKNGEKPQDEYSKEDIQKLTDILKSVEKK